MKSTLTWGLITTMLVMFLSLEGDLSNYIQIHSIIIVLGGTLTILVFSNPLKVLKTTMESIKDLFNEDVGFADFQSEILELSEKKKLSGKSEHPLIQYAHDLWEQGIQADLFIALLSQKRNELIAQQMDGVQSMKNLAKYPPALGMTGTVMGMVALFASLDSDGGDIGKSLSIAMTATFFGLVTANGVLSPLADRLQSHHISYRRNLTSIYEILLLINQGEPVTLISEEVGNRAA